LPSTPQLAPHVAIWSAPYTVDPATLATTAKKVADWDGVQLVPQATTTIVSNGIYAFLETNGIYLARLADGKPKVIPTLPNVEYGYPVYATDTKVWIIAIEQVEPRRCRLRLLALLLRRLPWRDWQLGSGDAPRDHAGYAFAEPDRPDVRVRRLSDDVRDRHAGLDHGRVQGHAGQG